MRLTYDQVVGHELRFWRLAAEVTLLQAAQACGLQSVSAMSRIETGDTACTVERLRAYAIVIERNPVHLLRDIEARWRQVCQEVELHDAVSAAGTVETPPKGQQ